MEYTTKITKPVAEALDFDAELERARAQKPGWEPTTNERVVVWDSEDPELGLRVYPNGRKVWLLRYRVSGRRRLMQLGRYGKNALTTAKARDRLKDELGNVLNGGDPVEERRRVNADTVGDAWNHFKSTALTQVRSSTARNYRGTYNKHVKGWSSRRLDGITKHDVERRYAEIAERSHYAANDWLRLLRRLLGVADLPDPSKRANLGGRRPGQMRPERKRTRTLNGDEAKELVKKLADAEPDFRDYVRLLMLTGARPYEWRLAEWDWLDLDAGVWRIPADVLKIKLDAEHQERKLPSAAVELLRERRDSQTPASRFIFPMAEGDRPRSRNWGVKPWAALREAAELDDDVTLYTLRHTFGTRAIAAGLSLPAVAAIMGHVDKTTTLDRYAHAVDDGQAQAAEAAAGAVEALAS